MEVLIVAASGVPAALVLVLMAAGVIIGVAGHATRSRRTAAVGVALVFVATALMIVGAFVAFQDDPTDSRPRGTPGGF